MKSNLQKTKDFIFRYILITLGAFMYAVAIALFLNPHNLAPGGISEYSPMLYN